MELQYNKNNNKPSIERLRRKKKKKEIKKKIKIKENDLTNVKEFQNANSDSYVSR